MTTHLLVAAENRFLQEPPLGKRRRSLDPWGFRLRLDPDDFHHQAFIRLLDDLSPRRNHGESMTGQYVSDVLSEQCPDSEQIMIQPASGIFIRLGHGVGQHRIPGKDGFARRMIEADPVDGMPRGVDHFPVKIADLKGFSPPNLRDAAAGFPDRVDELAGARFVEDELETTVSQDGRIRSQELEHSHRVVSVAVGKEYLLNVCRLVSSSEEIDKGHVIVSGIDDRETLSLHDVHVRGKCVSGQEEDIFEKRIRRVKKTRQRLPTGILRLPLVRGFSVLYHTHPAPFHDRCPHNDPLPRWPDRGRGMRRGRKNPGDRVKPRRRGFPGPHSM